jgi:hypothetical protein
VKVPEEVLVKIAELGQRVIDDDDQITDAGHDGAVWLRDKKPVFALAVLEDWTRKQARSWIYGRTRAALADVGAHENGTLPFPELHPHLEVAPGVLKHQTVMTGADWDRTLAIYRNRREQAEVLFRQVERRYNQVRPLLVTEDLTTNDILAELGLEALAG